MSAAKAPVLDRRSGTITVGDVVISLTPSECVFMGALFRFPGQFVANETMFEALCSGRSLEGSPSLKCVTIMAHNVRCKFREAGVSDLIETRRGFGMRLVSASKVSINLTPLEWDSLKILVGAASGPAKSAVSAAMERAA